MDSPVAISAKTIFRRRVILGFDEGITFDKGILGSEQGVDKRPGGRSTEQHQQAKEHDQDHDRGQPPFLVVLQKVDEFAHHSNSLTFGTTRKVLPTSVFGQTAHLWVLKALRTHSELPKIPVRIFSVFDLEPIAQGRRVGFPRQRIPAQHAHDDPYRCEDEIEQHRHDDIGDDEANRIGEQAQTDEQRSVGPRRHQ